MTHPFPVLWTGNVKVCIWDHCVNARRPPQFPEIHDSHSHPQGGESMKRHITSDHKASKRRENSYSSFMVIWTAAQFPGGTHKRSEFRSTASGLRSNTRQFRRLQQRPNDLAKILAALHDEPA